jgi:hypothetical protein
LLFLGCFFVNVERYQWRHCMQWQPQHAARLEAEQQCTTSFSLLAESAKVLLTAVLWSVQCCSVQEEWERKFYS